MSWKTQIKKNLRFADHTQNCLVSALLFYGSPIGFVSKKEGGFWWHIHSTLIPAETSVLKPKPTLDEAKAEFIERVATLLHRSMQSSRGIDMLPETSLGCDEFRLKTGIHNVIKGAMYATQDRDGVIKYHRESPVYDPRTGKWNSKKCKKLSLTDCDDAAYKIVPLFKSKE